MAARFNYDVWRIKVVSTRFSSGFFQIFLPKRMHYLLLRPREAFHPETSFRVFYMHARPNSNILYAFEYKHYTFIYNFIEICRNKSPTRLAPDIDWPVGTLFALNIILANDLISVHWYILAPRLRITYMTSGFRLNLYIHVYRVILYTHKTLISLSILKL